MSGGSEQEGESQATQREESPGELRPDHLLSSLITPGFIMSNECLLFPFIVFLKELLPQTKIKVRMMNVRCSI